MELTLLDGERFLKYLPSMVATCCTYMSLQTLGVNNFVCAVAIYITNSLLSDFLQFVVCVKLLMTRKKATLWSTST